MDEYTPASATVIAAPIQNGPTVTPPTVRLKSGSITWKNTAPAKTVTDIFEGQLEIENGTIKVGPDMQTSVPNVYAAGESVDSRYRQVIVSAALGAQAGISVSKTY